MRIVDFRIKSYASFEDSGSFALGKSMNVIAGQNNVGKTAALQALSLRINAKPHRNSSHDIGSAAGDTSTVELSVELSGSTFKHICMQKSGALVVRATEGYQDNPGHFLKILFTAETVEIKLLIHFYVSGASYKLLSMRPVGTTFELMSSRANLFYYHNEVDEFKTDTFASAESDTIPKILHQHLIERIYYFSAARSPRSFSTFGASKTLVADASNLAEVLASLQSNTYAFARYVRKVRRVLPAVKWVSTRAIEGSNEVEILIWNVEAETEREDLANPLSECGTGVGHVLAIIYLVHRSSGDIILIDEPNSFLHPGAARSLAEILRENDNHQFVLATHAPEVMSAARPDKFFKLQMINEKTTIREASYSNMEEAKQILSEIGSRLSDILGYDKIIWVEGPSEVQALPLIASHVNRKIPSNIAFLALRSTGDLENKQAAAFAEVYRNISSANTTIPEPLAILLDGDKAGDTKIRSLNSRFPNSVTFLGRRTFENYLLSARAITALLNTLPSFAEDPIAESQVIYWLQQNGSNKRYGANGADVMGSEWKNTVDSSKLLPDLFQDISEAREIYKKPMHTVELLRWSLDNEPSEVAELIEIVARIIPE